MIKVLIQNTMETDFIYKKRVLLPQHTGVIVMEEKELFERCTNRDLRVAYYFGG